MPFQDPSDYIDAYAAQLKKEKAAKRKAALLRAAPWVLGLAAVVVVTVVVVFSGAF